MNKGKIVKWFLIIPGVILIYSIIMSFCKGRDNGLSYFIVPLYHVISIFIAIFFAYYLTQVQNDDRKKRDILESIIGSILKDIKDTRMYDIESESDVEYIRVTQRSVKNRFDLIEKLSENLKLNLESDIHSSRENFDVYWFLVSEQIANIQQLNAIKKSLKNQVLIVADKLEKLRVDIYIL